MDSTVPSTQTGQRGIRRKLVWLTLACVLPAATMMAILIGLQWQQGQERQQRDTLLTARAMARSVGSDFAGLEAALRVLGDSPTLHAGDFRLFRSEAENVRRSLELSTIALFDAGGAVLMDLGRPAGAPLPPHRQAARVRALADAPSPARAELSDPSRVVNAMASVDLWVPVRGEGGTVFVLQASFDAARVARIFGSESLPPTWIASVYDASGHIVARTHEPQQFVGERARDDTLQNIRQGPGGSFDGVTIKGTPVRYTYSRMPGYDWAVTIGIPQRELDRELLATVGGLALASAVLIGGGLLLAFLMADRVRAGVRTAELREAYQLARSSEQRVRTIIEAAQDPFVAVDLRGRIVDWNTSAEVAFGWAREEIVGQRIADTLVPARFADRIDPSLQRFMASGESPIVGHTVERVLADRGGAERTFEVKIAFVDTGDQRFFAAFMHDISRRKEVERLKAEFVATVSHELRTPLTAIYGSLGLLNSGAAGTFSTAAADLVRLSHQSCARLVRLVNDILDVEKFSSGRADYTFRVQPLWPAMEQAMADVRPYAEGLGVGLDLVAGDDVQVEIDRDRIVQVLVNLLSNAVKFSPRGRRVELRLRTEGQRVRVAVIDHGPGVPPEFNGRIFERFAQADTSDRRLKGGTGLGLSICRSILAAHGGTIAFASEPGVQTEFFFELPVAVARG